MNYAVRPYILFLALFCIGAAGLSAQDETTPGNLLDLYPAGDDYFIEVVALPGPSTNTTRTLVLFSFTHNLLTFRTDGRGGERRYRALPEIYVEAIDREGVVVDFGRWSDTVLTDDYRSTLSKEERAHGFLEMSLRPGEYTFSYRVEKGESEGGFSKVSDPQKIPDLGGEAIALGTPLFVDHILGDPKSAPASVEFLPLGIDGNGLFGHPFRLLLTARAPDKIFSMTYRVVALDSEGGLVEEVLAGDVERLGRSGMMPGEVAVRDGAIFLGMTSDEASSTYSGVVDVEGGELAPGAYRLFQTITTESGSETESTDFSVRWIDRPLSLGDPTFAIRALYPIATEEEISRLLSGDKDRQGHALQAYWDRSDPSPGTIYNEKMVAYYRRVDYAFFNFATFRKQDGSRTDRGKIYILYGPPTEVDRELDPEEGSRETWSYENKVNRTFVFLDRSESGNYQLVEYYDL